MPRIQQISIVSLDPERLARFYEEVFEMKRVDNKGAEAIYLTDGHLNLTIFPNRAEGKPNGLNHIGFTVEDEAVIAERMKTWGLAAPKGKGVKRPTAKNRGTDPDGNNFNLSETGYEMTPME
jgi:catechol 2,3-dioxygenase-like lactoylglutathione lyase family enzyme